MNSKTPLFSTIAIFIVLMVGKFSQASPALDLPLKEKGNMLTLKAKVNYFISGGLEPAAVANQLKTGDVLYTTLRFNLQVSAEPNPRLEYTSYVNGIDSLFIYTLGSQRGAAYIPSFEDYFEDFLYHSTQVDEKSFRMMVPLFGDENVWGEQSNYQIQLIKVALVADPMSEFAFGPVDAEGHYPIVPSGFSGFLDVAAIKHVTVRMIDTSMPGGKFVDAICDVKKIAVH